MAAKLSYLLWMAPPDDALLRHAADGSLLEPETLARQTERLLDDRRCRRFLDDFCRQWLRLDRHANVAVDPERHPDCDDDLAELTIRETLETFRHVFDSGGSALELLDAEYALVNDRLATRYGKSSCTASRALATAVTARSILGDAAPVVRTRRSTTR